MKDDKKKLIVVLSLAAVIIAVGVFQFAAQGSPAAPPPAAKTAKKDDAKKLDPTQPEAEAPKNPTFALNLAARNPFEQPAGILQDPVKPTTQPTPPPAQKPISEIHESRHPIPMPDSQISGMGSGFSPVAVAVPEPTFNFRLSGVMLGARPMAVFTDPQGNQRLLMLGGSLDPDSKVTSIDKDAVTVRFHGKTLRLTVEGNPNAK
jgi:hypothetical protein